MYRGNDTAKNNLTSRWWGKFTGADIYPDCSAAYEGDTWGLETFKLAEMGQFLSCVELGAQMQNPGASMAHRNPRNTGPQTVRPYLAPGLEENPRARNHDCKSKCNMAEAGPETRSVSAHARCPVAQLGEDTTCVCQGVTLSSAFLPRSVLGLSNQTDFLGIFDLFPCLFSEYGYIYLYR